MTAEPCARTLPVPRCERTEPCQALYCPLRTKAALADLAALPPLDRITRVGASVHRSSTGGRH